jgi:hypothetical protein
MRHFAWLLVAAAASGCGRGRSSSYEDYPQEPPSSYDTEFTVDPEIYQHPRTSELGTHRTRGIAKTIEWQKMGTELGTSDCSGLIVVDHVLRDDAQNLYGVRVRLKNTKNERSTVQWRIFFYNLQGEPMIGLNHSEMTAPGTACEPRWKSICVEPLGLETVTDACRVTGAVAFRLFVRTGGNGEGLPDGFGKR